MRCTVLLLLLSVALAGCLGGGGGINLAVGTEATIRGFVRDANNNPVAGAEVSTFVNNQIVRTTSGQDGSFVLRFPLTSQTVVTVTAQMGNQSASVPVLAKPGAETTNVILVLGSPFSGGGVGAETPPPPPF
ncbi:MAG: hypothetical protein LKKZDAJK_000729 [Candidatus Fervidibacter sp.]